MTETLIVLERLHGQQPAPPQALLLPLTAEQRTSLRGRRRTLCGREVLLQLPRQGPLDPGDLLTDRQDAHHVRVTAAEEDLLEVQGESPLQLLQAAYHLGNRHVPLQVTESWLRYQHDHVLDDMVRGLGLDVAVDNAPFQPESGAYARNGGGHHSHSHDQAGGHHH